MTTYQYKFTPNGKKIPGSQDRTVEELEAEIKAKFQVDDLVQVPGNEIGIVVALSHEDEGYFYYDPVIQFADSLMMYNPANVTVIQRDGRRYHVDPDPLPTNPGAPRIVCKSHNVSFLARTIAKQPASNVQAMILMAMLPYPSN